MMDAISILNGVKNKVLDATNYELLKRNYELQNDNIEQLKTSNEAFKEGNERLQGEVDGLKAENESLKQAVAQLNRGSVSSGLSEVAVAILELYRERSAESLYKESQIIPSLTSNFDRIHIQSGIDDLEEAKMIEWSHRKSDLGHKSFTNRNLLARFDERDDDDDIAYSLTKQGRKHLVKEM